MTTPDVFEVLQGLVQQYPSSVLGPDLCSLETVLNDMDAKSAIKGRGKVPNESPLWSKLNRCIHPWSHGGASAVLLSDVIFEKDAMRKRNYDRIHELACRAALQGKEIK
ncbi:hypothetical protein IFM89_013834, partial [Coptis chinensis]